MLPARHRLRSSADFNAVLRRRDRVDGSARFVVVHTYRAPGRGNAPCRVGFVVSKTVGNAVIRNRTKRRLREQCRARLEALRPGVDYVVRARAAAGTASSAELGVALDEAFGRADRAWGARV